VGADYSWSFEPGVLLAVGAYLVVYARRWRSARAQAGSHAAPGWRLAVTVAGLGALLLALVSPVDRLGDQLLLMHMAQHLLLIDVAAIFLILGLTRVILRPVTARLALLERAAGPLGHPVFAALAYVAAMSAWHIPAAYDLALEHPAAHVAEHISFAIAGGLYWWHLLSPIPGRHRLTGLGPIAYMAGTKLLVGLLGILITFSPDVLYGWYERQPRVWGLSALEDQNAAGALMALEQSIVMGIALFWLFARMLGESERADQRAERFGVEL